MFQLIYYVLENVPVDIFGDICQFFGMVARTVRINFSFGDICRNEFLLFGTVARTVRMNLNF